VTRAGFLAACDAAGVFPLTHPTTEDLDAITDALYAAGYFDNAAGPRGGRSLKRRSV
jgi:hypothetical protein